MKRVKISMKAYSFLLGALAVAALLFSACDNVLTQPETQLDGYARVKINIVGENPEGLERTTLPSLLTDVAFEYFFTTEKENGEWKEGKRVKPNTDNEFLLDPGEYQVTVKAFKKVGYTDGGGSNLQGAEGKAEFSVPPPPNSPFSVKVLLKAQGAATTGGIDIAIDYPPSATATVTLFKWAEREADRVPVGLTTAVDASGSYNITKDGLDIGYYRLTVSIKETGVGSAGTVEAIHVYPNLTTSYRKTFTFKDMSSPISIKGVAITIPEPHEGMTKSTLASSVGGLDSLPVTKSSTLVKWEVKSGETFIASPGAFGADNIYKVTITLTASDGYNFTGLSNKGSTPTATINGEKADIVKTDGTSNDPVPGGTTAGTITLSVVFPILRAVDTIAVANQPRKLIYSHKDKLDLTGLSARVTYTTGTPLNVSIPYSDFGKWNIKVLNHLGDPMKHDETLLDIETYDTTTITIKYNDDDGKKDETNPLTINPKIITSNDKITIKVEPSIYDGLEDKTPGNDDVIVKDDNEVMERGTDYTVEFTSVTTPGTRTNAGTYQNVVTVNGIGHYAGTKRQSFVINQQDISSANNIVITPKLTDPANPIKYDGTGKEPAVTVKNNRLADDKQTLVPGTKTGTTGDYYVEYTNNTDVVLLENLNAAPKPPTATITGKGNYKGSKAVKFPIDKGEITADTLGKYLATTGVWNPAVDGYNKRYDYDGIAKEATVTLRSSMTWGGTVTPAITYTGVDPGQKPKNAGSYDVKLSVPGATNFETIANVSLGKLVIDKADLVREDFEDLAPRVYSGDPQKVDATTEIKLDTKTPGVVTKTGMGTPSNVRYTYPNTTEPSSSVPRDAGTYPITVNVNSGDNFNATPASGLVVGQLIIKKKTPVYSTDPALTDFNINGAGNVPFDGSPKQVIVTPRVTSGTPPSGGNQMTGAGAITVYYTNTSNNTITTTAPSAQGTYWITFDVAGGVNFESGVNLGASNDSTKKISLIIGRATPAMTDFDVTLPGSLTYDGTAKTVTVAKKSGIVGMGDISVKYTTTTPAAAVSEVPKNVGKYTIVVDVTLGDNYLATTGLIVGWMEIVKKAPAKDDFTITVPTTGYTATSNGWTVPLDKVGAGVSVVLKSSMSGAGTIGAVTYKSTAGTTITTVNSLTVGTYTVTFTVPGGSNFTDAAATTGITAGTLVITAPPAANAVRSEQ